MRLFRIAITIFATIVGDALIGRVQKMIEGAPADSDFQSALGNLLDSQGLALMIYRRYGLPGLATAYDHRIISVADFALYVAIEDSQGLPAMAVDLIQKEEAAVTETSFLSTLFGQGSGEFSEVTTDVATTRRLYSFLISARSF